MLWWSKCPPQSPLKIDQIENIDGNKITPSGFVTRPLAMEDAGCYADTLNAIWAHIGIDDRTQPENALLEWKEPGFELGRSSIGIFDGNGLLAGYATFWATAETPVRPNVDWGVHPRYQNVNLENYLLGWANKESSEVIPRCPANARISLCSGTHQGYAFADNTMVQAGFSASRSSYDMEIKMIERPAPPAFPEGIVARSYDHGHDLPLLVDVVRDSFSDHYGFIEEPYEKDFELFRHWLDNNPYFDPELVIFPVAEATGEVVGCLLGLTQDHRDPAAGYIDSVGVRQPYRRRGLASAMLQHSFATFWDRGTKTVHLDVDGESLTNAVALYERAGMHVYRRYTVYEKVLREGVELAKVAMD